MSFTGKWWITPAGDMDVSHSEHVDYAIAAMLLMDRPKAPHMWNVKGVPKEELAAALMRGVDAAAIDFLEQKKDARLWVIREFGWIRTAKSAWNLWEFNEKTAEIARSSKEYWRAQYSLNDHDSIDVTELKDGCRYAINVKKFLDGGNPKILKRLALGGVECEAERTATPQYSTEKYTEIERRRLTGRTGDNPRKNQ